MAEICVQRGPAGSLSFRREMKVDLHSGGTLGSKDTLERWV